LGLARKAAEVLQHLSDSVTGPECIRTRRYALRELDWRGDATCKRTA
jgi:hypothetical protein